jgi:hypothetical protein
MPEADIMCPLALDFFFLGFSTEVSGVIDLLFFGFLPPYSDK